MSESLVTTPSFGIINHINAIDARLKRLEDAAGLDFGDYPEGARIVEAATPNLAPESAEPSSLDPDVVTEEPVIASAEPENVEHSEA